LERNFFLIYKDLLKKWGYGRAGDRDSVNTHKRGRPTDEEKNKSGSAGVISAGVPFLRGGQK